MCVCTREMREGELRALIPDVPRLPVRLRRELWSLVELHDLDVWVCCEACGRTSGLACYHIVRRTRFREGSAPLRCGACAARIPHGRMLSE